MTIPSATDNLGAQWPVPVIPDVSGLSPGDTTMAACVYVDAGLYVLPVRVGKHPGSIVGPGWPKLSSRDPRTVCGWWTQHPDAGIAIHTGKSRLIAFDLDENDLPGELAWLKTGLIQSTRRGGGDRAHYVFSTDEVFVSGDLKLADGTVVGDIKSGNSVIMAQPSPHAKADEDGEYRWRATGLVPALPDEARALSCLRRLGIARTSNSAEAASGGAGGWGVIEASSELVTEAKADWTNDDRPKALTGLVNSIREARVLTRNKTRNALRITASESRIGFYPLQTAIDEIKSAAIDSYIERGENYDAHIGAEAFKLLIANGVGYALSRSLDEIEAEANRDYGEHARDYKGVFDGFTSRLRTESNANGQAPPKNSTQCESSIFIELRPTEWAKPVEPTKFMVKNALVTDTFGVNGGPEKSLKTHDNASLALAVSTGTNMYRSDLFPVLNAGTVLYIVGEGGSKQIRRLLHRMCRAYGVDPADVAKDPAFPLVVAFGAAPLDSDRLRDEIKRLLDRHQPDLVLMESFYNFHPAEVNAANLYERGQVIDAYHKLVRDGGSDVVSLLTDHNKKGANELGLKHISMSGQAENSDSWIQRKHRYDPDVQAGEFQLTTSFNGRDWGGSIFDVDWHLGPFDHDAGCHVGDISWDVNPNRSNVPANQMQNLLRMNIAKLISDDPFKFVRTEIASKLPVRKADVLAEIKKMIEDNLIVEERAKDHGRTDTTAKVLGPAPTVIARSKPAQAGSGGQP